MPAIFPSSTSSRFAFHRFGWSHVAWALFGLLSLTAVIRPIVEYDSWSYHLPFSARLFGIGGDSYQPDLVLERRYEGFPLAWNWIQGLLWKISGSLRAVALPQVALLTAFFLALGRERLILAFLACPLLLLHQQSILNDLPAGLCLTLALFLGLRSSSMRQTLIAAALLALAGNIKVQSLLAAFIVAAIVGAVLARDRRWRDLAILAAGLALANATAFSNLTRTGNPLYPFNVVIGGNTLFAGPENPMVDANPPTYQVGARRIAPPQSIGFALSASELDFTLRGVPPRYSMAMEAGNAPLKGGPSRTGGWGQLFVLASIVLLAARARRWRSLDRQERRELVAVTLLIAAVACLPRSHELRYFLVVPLSLAVLFARSVPPALLAIGAGFTFVQVALNPNSHLVGQREAIPTHAPSGMVGKTMCNGPRDGLMFRYSNAVTGEPTRIVRCTGVVP